MDTLKDIITMAFDSNVYNMTSSYRQVWLEYAINYVTPNTLKLKTFQNQHRSGKTLSIQHRIEMERITMSFWFIYTK